MAHRASSVALSSRLLFAGAGEIRDIVTLGTPAVPVARRVALLVRRTIRLVATTWSDPVTGEYVFEQLATDIEFVVLALDYERNYNAVIADGIFAALPEAA